MKRISEIIDKLYQNQLLHTCNVVLENKAKVSSIVIKTDIYEAIQPLITKMNLVYKSYELDVDFNLVVIAKHQESIDIMEEINELAISKGLKDTIYKSLLGTV